MKECSLCHLPKDPIADFYAVKAYKDGRASRCKQCMNAVAKQWDIDNPERKKARVKKHNKLWRNSPAGKEYYEANKEKRRIYLAKRAIEKADEIKQKAAEYYQRTKVERDACAAVWRKAHPKEWTAIHKRWVARKKGATINDFTESQWQDILVAYNFSCAYCDNTNIELTQDHIIALSKGGPNTASNIVPACRSCNSRKNAGPPPNTIATIFAIHPFREQAKQP